MNSSAAIEALLRTIGPTSGDEFFQASAKELGAIFGATDVFYAFAVDDPPTKVRVHHIWQEDGDGELFEYDLEGTPCQIVYNGEATLIPCDVCKNFPEEFDTEDESFVGVPIFSPDELGRNKIIGHLAIYSERPIEDSTGFLEVARLFGHRAQAEIERAGYEQRLRKTNEELSAKVSALTASNELLKQRELELKDLAVREAAITSELAQETAFKDRLYSIVAHDLRSPFNALIGYSDLMLQFGADTPKDRFLDYAGAINSASKTMFQLLENLLAWTQLQTSEKEVAEGPVDLKSCVEESVALYGINFQQKNLTLEQNIEPITVHANRNTVLLVVRNLLGNALKFTPTGGRVTVSVRQEDENGALEVSDTGVGMGPDILSTMFDLEKTTSALGTGGEVGTGLGLPLCKQMLELGSGTITVYSTPGEGSTFQVTLPLSN